VIARFTWLHFRGQFTRSLDIALMFDVDIRYVLSIITLVYRDSSSGPP
jgi:hypothetical protein